MELPWRKTLWLSRRIWPGLGEELVECLAADELALRRHAVDDGAAVVEQGRVEPDFLDRGVELVREGLARGWSRWHNGIVSP